MTTAQGPIGHSRTKPWPEGADRPKPKRDVTPALPHARRIILLTGRYKPKIMEEGGECRFNRKDEQKKGMEEGGERWQEPICSEDLKVICQV